LRIIATNLGAGRLVAADRIRTIGTGTAGLRIARRTIGYADDVLDVAVFIAVKRTFGVVATRSMPATIRTITILVGFLPVTIRISFVRIVAIYKVTIARTGGIGIRRFGNA
jgi:hypothetical protein